PYEAAGEVSFLDSKAGRLVLALVRIVNDPDDYVAHRVILGLLSLVGIVTCASICQSVIHNNLNFRDIFAGPLPDGVFVGRALAALKRARAVREQISDWHSDDPLGPHV